MASEKIDALELDINAKLTTENLDKLITALGKLSKALDNVNAKKVKDDIKETGDNSKEAAEKADILTNSFVNQAVKITALIAVYRKLADVISDGIANSMSYVENLNLFTVSLGEYADNASKYAETVRDALGIDYSEWERTQGVFNTLIEGFGVTGDKAAYMSQNLTQLTYDIASFYNLSFSEAEKKLQSAVAGELEPVRRIGYDLSQAQLTAIAQNPKYYGQTTYAINEETGAIEANSEAWGENVDRQIANFNELTQAEKVQLRYIALMTQVTEVQGDMARTLNDPANQMRIFKEQLTMTSRALGNAFIPLLNQTLPYLTAFFNILEEGLQKIAAWFGYEIPDMSDRMDVSDAEPYYENIVEATGRAAKNAKKIKDYTIGLDELNVLRPDDNTGTGGSGSTPNYGNLATDLITPGYDFLTTAIENRVKEAKELLEKFGQDLSEHPIEVVGKVLWEGFGTIGEGFWEWFIGKTPEELAQDAWDSGISVGEAFANAVFYKMGENIVKISTGIWGAITGEDTTIAERAAQSGRTIAQQFFGEASRTLLEFVNSNEYLKWYYETVTGRNADEDLVAAYKYLDANKVNTKKVKDGNFTLTGVLGDKSTTSGISKGAQAQANAYINGLKNSLGEVEKVGEDIFNSAWSGADNKGRGVESFFKTSSNMSRRYADGLVNGTTGAANAGKSLYNSGYNGATNYGRALADYYNVSSGASSNYAKGLVNGTTGASYAGQSLYASGYNGANNYGNGGKEYSNLADNFANLFAGALSSNSALSGSYNSGYKLANEGTWGAYDLNSEFEYVGDMAGQGYVAGIRKNEYKAEYAGGTVANATLYRMKEVLGIASPSKEAYAVGKFFDEGFANAISDFTNLATDNASNMAELSLKAMRTTQGMFSGFSVPTNNNAGYGVGAMNEGAMMNMASTIYQAVASGISTLNLNGDDRDIKVIIDGKEVFKVVQKEQRDRGVAISNGAFSR